jgi:hypothetical protein
MSGLRESLSPAQTASPPDGAFLERWPTKAYMTKVDTWRELPGGEIEFMMKAPLIIRRGAT